MSPQSAILKDLLMSPTTVSSMAGRLNLSEFAIKAILDDLVIAGTVMSYPLECLTIYRLTREDSVNPVNPVTVSSNA